jgi:hypothetical protein
LIKAVALTVELVLLIVLTQQAANNKNKFCKTFHEIISEHYMEDNGIQ